MDKDTLWGVKQIVEEFGDQLTGNTEDLEYDRRTAEENKKEVNRLHNELDELYTKAQAFDQLLGLYNSYKIDIEIDEYYTHELYNEVSDVMDRFVESGDRL